MKPSPDRLSEIFCYLPEEGVLSRLNRPDKPVGTPLKNGSLVVNVDGGTYPAHCIVWALMTGSWPDSKVSHRDGNKANNKFDNLCLSEKPINLIALEMKYARMQNARRNF